MNLFLPIVCSTFREIVRQPFYFIISFSGFFLILLSFSFTFFAFGEEVRLIRDMAVSTITIGGLLTGCLASSLLITGEFERQTVLAVLCKPVARIHFILGKYLGVLAATFLSVLSQGLVLEVALIVKQFSGIESDATNIWDLIDFVCILGICFSSLQILILTAVSLVLSLYFNIIANLTICLLFFLLCNTFGYYFPCNFSAHNIVSYFKLIPYVFFPDFQSLSMELVNEVVHDSSLNWQKSYFIQYVVYEIIYCVTYSIFFVFVAVLLFRRKEII